MVLLRIEYAYGTERIDLITDVLASSASEFTSAQLASMNEDLAWVYFHLADYAPAADAAGNAMLLDDDRDLTVIVAALESLSSSVIFSSHVWVRQARRARLCRWYTLASLTGHQKQHTVCKTNRV